MSIPPGPPLPPPPPENPRSKISPIVLKLRSTPPSNFYQPPNPPPTINPSTTPTGPYFFYGTLTDPSMVTEILNLNQEPKSRPAIIKGYECKMWGQYPALVDGSDTVEGAVYCVQTAEDGLKLAAYETNNYRAESCIIKYTDGREPAEEVGYMFKFVGNLRDLHEGRFELRAWLRLMGKEDAVGKLDARIYFV